MDLHSRQMIADANRLFRGRGVLERRATSARVQLHLVDAGALTPGQLDLHCAAVSRLTPDPVRGCVTHADGRAAGKLLRALAAEVTAERRAERMRRKSNAAR
jgi:hypothetical protein